MAKTLAPSSELDSGKYRIVRLLGQGGMGSVFEAEHRETQKRVAIKCLHPIHAADTALAERLVREAQAAARLRHPNVVDVYDIVRDGASIYLVMEYLEGETLAEALARRDLALHTIIGLLIAAMRGVAAAHEQGVIHRDIKPDNIFLAREAEALHPVPKLLDFGISKLDGRGVQQRSLTGSGVALGTPSYMSYEQLTGETIDGRVDVYAFGVILYEALTGHLPYQADTFPELMIRFTTRTPAPPKALRSDLPSALSQIVMKALARDREQRTASIEVLIGELEQFAVPWNLAAEASGEAIGQLAGAWVGSADSMSAAEIAWLRRTHRWTLRRLSTYAAVGGALLLLLLVVALIARLAAIPPQHTLTPAASVPAPERARPQAFEPAPVPSPVPAADPGLTDPVELLHQPTRPAVPPSAAVKTAHDIVPERSMRQPKVVVPAPLARRPRDLGIY